MSLNVIDGDCLVRGTLSVNKFNPAAGSVTDASVNASAGIQTTKLRHRYTKHYAQPNATAITETKTTHVVRGTNATIMEAAAGSIVANIGGATVTIDVKKNGTSVLNSVITLNSSNTGRVAVTGSLNGALVGCVAGDWIEVVVTATVGGGTLATGVYAQVMIDEDPS
jgi:hypothetical protein